jgi:HAMP domain-containing protein/signal transduction histidine kinase
VTGPTTTGRRFVSLGTKLAAVTSCVLVLVSACLFIELTTRERTKLIAAKTSAASMLTQLLATELAAALDFGDADDVARQLGHLKTNPDIAGAAVWSDPSEAPTASWTSAGVPVLTAPNPGDPDGALVSPEWLVSTRTVVNPKGKPMGRFRVSFSLRPENEAFRTSRRHLFWMTSGFTLATALLLMLLARRYMIGPLHRLAAAAGAVAEGDMSVHVEVEANDEIGNLTRAFNLMGKAVASRQEQIESRNKDMQLVLDHVAQGLFTIDRDGLISPEYSRALADWLGPPAPGETLWSYFAKFDRDLGLGLRLGWQAVIDDVLPLELTLDQMPRSLSRGGQELRFGYRPIVVDARLAKALVVVSDVTSEIARERADAAQRELLQVFELFTKDREGFSEFFSEADTLVHAIVGAKQTSLDLQRSIHTLKGNCAQFGLARVAELCHRLEGNLLEPGGEVLSEAGRGELLDTWSDAASKLTTFLGETTATRIEVDEDEYEQLQRALSAGVPHLRIALAVRRWRMEPAARRLDRVARQARSLASRLGKGAVNVAVEPNGVRLDARGWAPFWSAFVHVVRNALDHGIEAEDERLAAGKKGAGTVTIRTYVVADELVVEAADDGRGIDWDAIAERCRSLGRPCTTPKQKEEALFHGGISTRAEVSEYSGRGMGMGAVAAACARLSGHIRVHSVRGEGTVFQFRFPALATTAASAGGNVPAKTEITATG